MIYSLINTDIEMLSLSWLLIKTSNIIGAYFSLFLFSIGMYFILFYYLVLRSIKLNNHVQPALFQRDRQRGIIQIHP